MNERTGGDGQPGIEPLLDTWPDWSLGLTGRPQLIGPVPGGRTNRNFRLDAPGLSSDLLLRVNHPEPERLGIDREREKTIITVTAQAGISRPFLYWDPDQRFVVFPHLPGRPWTDADLRDGGQRQRLWPLLERLHALDAPRPRRRYLDYVLAYWNELDAAGAINGELRRRWQTFLPRLQAFDAGAWEARLVHHDLIPDNILESGSRLYFIDWEYAAAGHPDIDRWTIDPEAAAEPFVAELMGWINALWERLRSL